MTFDGLVLQHVGESLEEQETVPGISPGSPKSICPIHPSTSSLLGLQIVSVSLCPVSSEEVELHLSQKLCPSLVPSSVHLNLPRPQSYEVM